MGILLSHTVLIVDDSPTIRGWLKTILSDEYRVLEAENGVSALEILNSRSDISAVITDINMPVMDGFEFLEACHSIEKLCEIPIIVSTGEAESKNEIKCLNLGAWDFIKKPSDPEIVRFRVRNVIERCRLYALKKRSDDQQIDSLTGFYKKPAFIHKIYERLAEDTGEPLMVCCLDIYRFHQYNRAFGKAAGDDLLKYMARTMRYVFERDETAFFCRKGADTYYICARALKEEELDAICQSFDEALKTFLTKYNILVNWGVAYIDGSLNPPEALLRAKTATKMCKGSHTPNYCVYTDDTDKKIKENQTIVNSMDTAIDRREFALYVQPKYSLLDDRFEGGEVLVRWQKPNNEIVAPGKFIPVFENNGQIMKLDYHIWDSACAKIKIWVDMGVNPPPISVNVSRISIYNANIADDILEITKRHGVNPGLFQLELTESAYTEDISAVSCAIQKLQSYGFKILMDDFGSGYSSLTALIDFPVDVLKLDMKFLSAQNSSEKKRGKNILRNVTALAKDLGLTIIAEGVEAAEQAQFLTRLGCDFAQGYYFAKPMPIEQYEKDILRLT